MDIVGKRAWFFLISGLFILPGIISLIVPPAMKPGIEFSSGSIVDVTFEREISEDDIRTELARLDHPEALIQKTGENSVFIRMDVLEPGVEDEPSERELILDALGENLSPVTKSEVDTVSAIFAREMVQNSIIAVIVAAVVVFFYITWAFRSIPNSIRYGAAAIVALVHDMIFILGVFSILGKAMNIEVNSMFIMGIILVLGYSVNDTIVVFDRIRENVARNIDRPFPGVVNTSIMESMGRSLNTSMTTLFVLLALLLFGGPTIRGLLLVLAIGVGVGTYSSVCIASQFLVIWETGELGRFFRRVIPFMRREPAGSL